jgi:hypothetical protein
VLYALGGNVHQPAAMAVALVFAVELQRDRFDLREQFVLVLEQLFQNKAVNFSHVNVRTDSLLNHLFFEVQSVAESVVKSLPHLWMLKCFQET